ncbi:LacI family transcriptional regulator [Labedella gwakjiensis]|uniref:LacI family DNA-binding transcriptional regulator n=1 Tax=Labedella gwakjiensis TaxID=390269 RepID=A0A2P8GXA8_9MICO|nr:LacI family DNA-binding transcriptional regulator [Labedella gwakjiensis]PSL38603.1 LacI family transcriptional regulator [Labedella gwakjiensis]RUQ86893.1 LacI family DNA-binding transcriptional regulator [Labedella gwakjiensis]
MPPEAGKGRAPNIRDVAALAGVSYQTVSRVLNDSEKIRPETKRRVLAAIEESGFRPNQAARALVTSKSGTIGVLSTHQYAHYGPQTMVHAMEVAADLAGYRLALVTTGSTPETIVEALDRLVRQAVEALIVVAPKVSVFEAIEDSSLDLPLVTLDSSIHNKRPGRAHSFAVDQYEGARMATRHLIELGHRSIIHLAGPQDWIEADERMQGFLFELSENDLPVRAPILGELSADFGYRAGLELVRRRDFSAVFAANDQMALGLLHAFRDEGLSVPHDVSVVGFDDIPDAAHYLPPLTTVRQDFAAVGRRAVELVIRELDSGGSGGVEFISPTLMVRESTSPPPAHWR